MSRRNVQTIEDIAKLAGVSKSTVSRALNDSPLIAEETKERIRTIARESHFQMDVSAQRLSRQQSRTIAFVTHTFQADFGMIDLFGLEILGAISNALARNHYDLLMAHVNPYNMSWVSEYLDTGRADGFILMTSTRKQHHIKTLAEMHVPFIVWGVPLPHYSYCSVIGDDITGGRLAGEHLIATGRQKIAFLGGPADELEVQRRYEGFQSALLAADCPIDPALVAYADYTPETAAQVARRLLQQAADLDAIFANSDVMAIAAIDVIHETGRRVPEDVAVIGYDNLAVASVYQPNLTTISQNLPQVGRLLAENLIQFLQKGIVTNVMVPVELVVRRSA